MRVNHKNCTHAQKLAALLVYDAKVSKHLYQQNEIAKKSTCTE